MNRFDLHLHSKYSPDAIPKPESILKQAKALGLKGFAITDHNSTASFKEFRQLQKKEKETIIVLGEEVKIIEEGKIKGEMLCYFLQDEIKPASFEEIIEAAKKQGALTSIAHPFDFGRKPFTKDAGKEFRKVHALEVFNARAYSAEANRKALEFAEKRKLPFTAGSDAHSLQELGKAKSPEELRKAILKRKCMVFGTERTAKMEQGICSAKARLMLNE